MFTSRITSFFKGLMAIALLHGWAMSTVCAASGQQQMPPQNQNVPTFYPTYNIDIDTPSSAPSSSPQIPPSSGIFFPDSTSAPLPHTSGSAAAPQLNICVIPDSAIPAPTTEDDVLEIVRRHVVALGGIDTILSLRSILAKGTIHFSEKQKLAFQMWSARPNRVKIQTALQDRSLTEAYNGRDTPWMLDSSVGKAMDMAPEAIRPFIADAEFDDVLVSSLARDNVVLDYAGEDVVDGRPVAKLLATQNLTETSTLYIDRATYHIMRRDLVSKRTNLAVENYFFDYKLTGGVMLPTRIIQKQGGKTVYTVINEHIEANPPLESGFFDRP